MRNRFILILLGLVALSGWAQNERSLDISRPDIALKDNLLSVGLQGRVGKKYISKNYQLHLIPVIISTNSDSIFLPEIFVQGRLNRILETRAIRAGEKSNIDSNYSIAKGESFDYFVQIPFDTSMQNASLNLLVYKEGCCKTNLYNSYLLSEDLKIKLPDNQSDLQVAESDLILKNQTFNFLFEVSSIELLPALADNQQELQRLLDFLKKQSIDFSTLDHIDIVGFASPEGSDKLNQRLAENRALVLKEIVVNQIPSLPESKINVKNGGVNWNGLVELLSESKLSNTVQEQVKNLIQQGKSDYQINQNLKDLNQGEVYKYLHEELYPKLRQVYAIDAYWISEPMK